MLSTITAMSSGVQAIFYAIVIVLALIGAAKQFAIESKNKVDFFALAFAVFAFVFFWGALATK